MFIVAQILVAIISAVASTPTVFDQRQSGKTNVRVELKDAVIIAVGDGGFGGDYDYNYDYSDLTIKPGTPTASTVVPSKTTTGVPPKSTTAKVTTITPTSTATSNIIQNAAVLLEAENNSIIFSANIKPGNGSAEPVKVKPGSYKPDQIPVLVLQETHRPHQFLPVKTVEKQEAVTLNLFKETNSSSVSAKELSVRHCSPGFFLDDRNRCKRIRRLTRERPQLPIGLRFDYKPLIRS